MWENNTGKHHTHTCFMSNQSNRSLKSQKWDKMIGPTLVPQDGRFSLSPPSLFSLFFFSSFSLNLKNSRPNITTTFKLQNNPFWVRLVSLFLHKLLLKSWELPFGTLGIYFGSLYHNLPKFHRRCFFKLSSMVDSWRFKACRVFLGLLGPP